MYRQGDLLFVPVEELTGELEPEPRRSIVVAEGEVTGHKHELKPGKGGTVRTDLDVELFEIAGAAAKLTHPEHDTVELPEGKYELVRQREYEPGHAPRVVLD